MDDKLVQELKGQIDTLRNQINHLRSNIIRLDTRISDEISVAKIISRDIEVLKEAHQPGSERFHHAHKGDGLAFL